MKTRWYKYLTVLFVFLFIFPLNSKAECDYKRMAELNKIASNVQVVYNYDVGQDGVPVFKLNIGNITNDIYVEDNYGGIYEKNTENIVLDMNVKYKLIIFSKDGACFGEKLLTKYVQTPFFNLFANLSLCENRNDEKCNIWFNSSELTAADYYEPKDEPTTKEEKKVKQNNEMPVILFIVIGAAVTVIIIIFIVFRKKR